MTRSYADRAARERAERQDTLDAARTRTASPAPAEPHHDAATLLDFEEKHGRPHTGLKDTAIRAVLRLSPARYYVLLNRVIDTEEARTHNPILVNTLQIRRAIADRARRH